MSQPYISHRRMAANSLSAMLAAIEIYNKPRMEYRDEVTVLLVVNAWELALKAALKKAGRTIFYKKKRGEPYRTLAAEDALWSAWCFSDWGSFSSRESIGWRPCQQRNTPTSSRPKWCVR